MSISFIIKRKVICDETTKHRDNAGNTEIKGKPGANSMQVQKSYELAISDAFPTEKFITHVLPLSEINKGIELTRTGEAIKVVLLPNEE